MDTTPNALSVSGAEWGPARVIYGHVWLGTVLGHADLGEVALLARARLKVRSSDKHSSRCARAAHLEIRHLLVQLLILSQQKIHSTPQPQVPLALHQAISDIS